MGIHPQPFWAATGHALRWTPAEALEDALEPGLEARVLLWRGQRVGLAVHSARARRTVLLGPVAEALGEPDGWLNGLGPFEALERAEAAMQGVTSEELEEALAAWEGLEGMAAGQCMP